MKVLRAILRYSNKGALGGAIVLGALSGAASTVLLFLTNRALFLFNPAGDAELLWSFIGLCLFVAVARVGSSDILQQLGARMAEDLQLQLSRRILGAPLRRLEELGPHRLLVALTDDIRSLSAALMLIPIAAVNTAVVLGGLVYMTLLSWQMVVVVTLFMIFGSLTYLLALRYGGRYLTMEREKEDDLFKRFRAVTDGIQELKMRRPRRHGFFGLLAKTAAEFRRLRVYAMRIFIVGASWGNLLFFIVIGVVVFWGPTLENIERYELTGYTLVLLYILGPLQMVLGAAPNISRANVSFAKIERLGISLLRDAEETDAEFSGEMGRGWRQLELRGIEHTYHHLDEASNFTLGPLDLTLHPGELVFLVGGNGSGKTSLAKLLLGLYPPERGEIRFDGRTVDDHNREEYRNLFSVVFSNFFLFEQLLGLESPDLDEEARQYLEELQLQHKVRVTRGRLSTIDLSQGQRKRLALLTAVLEDRPIFLFDEWAADQDPEFKQVFYHQILPALRARGKAVVVISHDDRYYGVADRVIKLDYGQVDYDLPIAQSPFAVEAARPAV